MLEQVTAKLPASDIIVLGPQVEFLYCERWLRKVKRLNYKSILTLLGLAPLMVVILTRTATASNGGAAWYNFDWNQRQSITIDHTLVEGDLTNFPVLLTGAEVKSALFTDARSDGSDIVITAADGVTPLKRELVSFNPVVQTMEMYVKIPFLGASSDTVIYLYYDNPMASQPNDADTWDSHYIMVQHMEDNTSNAIRDSTIHHFEGVKGNVPSPDPNYRVIPSKEVNGKIGKAQDFDHSWINVGVHSDFNTPQQFTVEAWGYPDDKEHTYNSALVSHDYVDECRQWSLILMDGRLATLQVHTPWDQRAQGPEPNYNTWNYFAGVYNTNSEHTLYLNGNKYSTSPPGDPADDCPNTPLIIGTHYKLNWENNPSFLGIIDEVRISSIARSEGWIQTSRNNQWNPGAFYNVGEVERLIHVFLPMIR